jgi:hypothetical protein
LAEYLVGRLNVDGFVKSYEIVVFLLNHEEHEGHEAEIPLILHDLHALHGEDLIFYEAINVGRTMLDVH